MHIGTLNLTLHRTVRVADGRTPSNLPPSLGHIKAYKVSEYKDRCPESWENDAVFVALHDTEALWMSFHTGTRPLALLVGAGGINALTGQKLGTKLESGNYIVTPPQPWLDGWKSDDGCVYQFVATPYQKGEGKTVAEQLIGAESKTGAIGIAVFEPKDANLTAHKKPHEGFSGSAYDNDFTYQSYGMMKSKSVTRSASPVMDFGEMGIGKGGKIMQKVYPDPHGIEVWKDAPVAAVAIYVVNAQVFAEITGEQIPTPIGDKEYAGVWFGLDDSKQQDVAGTNAFSGLQSAFIGDTSNVATAEAATEIEAK